MKEKNFSATQTRSISAIQRRGALKSMLALGLAPMFIPGRMLGADAPSKKITLGFIGVGSHGLGNNLKNFLTHADAQVVAVCDVFKDRAEAAQQLVNAQYGNNDCRTHTDFRHIIADKTIDAVVISTPDHWHVPMSLMALEAGKDVFCEKPTKFIAEGRVLKEAVAKHQAIFQVGLEDRSVAHYHKMVEWVRNGAIGDLQRVELTLPDGFVWPLENEAPVPQGFDYNLFVGPAEFIPYTPSLTEMMHWRMIRNFSGGMIMDWGTHLVDTAQLAANAPEGCACEVEGSGIIPEKAMTNVPIKYDINCRYSNGVVVNIKNGGTAIRLFGSTGWLGNSTWRGPLEASDPQILRKKYAPETSKHWQMPPSEARNFLDCVKSRKPTTYTAEITDKLCTTLHMSDLAVRLGRELRWDASKEEFINDAEANALRSHQYRDWTKA